MKYLLLIALCLAAAPASAQTVQAGPMTIPGTCVVTAPTTATKIATLCGVTDTTIGVANFSVFNPSTTQIVCLGDDALTTSVTVGVGSAALHKCWPICDPSTGTECVGKVQPVRGSIHKWYLRATAGTKLYIIFGATP